MIDLAKARIIAVPCNLLTPAEARAAEAILFGDPGVGEMTWGMIRDRIARAVITVNPAAAARRREDAAKTRRVEVLPEGSGNAMIAGRELPPAAALAASENLTIRARELRAAGVPGDMDELRVLAYLEMLGALDPLDGAADDGGPAGTVDGGRGGGSEADDDGRCGRGAEQVGAGGGDQRRGQPARHQADGGGSHGQNEVLGQQHGTDQARRAADCLEQPHPPDLLGHPAADQYRHAGHREQAEQQAAGQQYLLLVHDQLTVLALDALP